MKYPAFPIAWRRVLRGLLALAMFTLLALAPVTSALADVSVGGGSDSNNTSLGLSGNGGTSIGDASGGSDNVAFVPGGNNCNDNWNNNNCCNWNNNHNDRDCDND